MKVTNLIQDIGKCRDIVCSRDFKTVLKNIGLFQNICDRLRRHVDKFIKSDKHKLDFTHYDLQELSDEIYNFIKGYQNKFLFEKGQKKLIKAKTIDNNVLRTFTHIKNAVLSDFEKLEKANKVEVNNDR